MITEKTNIRGSLISLRQIELRDCTSSYVAWLNDSEVTQYLETKWHEQDMETIKEFVFSQRENKDSILLAIVINKTNKHIGNIKIGPIHEHYRHAEISYFIGEKTFWNMGMITEAINLACKFAFEELKLHRIEAGVYEMAVGSWRALEKNGFKREGVFREQVYFKGRYIDIYRYGLLACEYIEIENLVL